jgi:phenylacetate-CoA ligase
MTRKYWNEEMETVTPEMYSRIQEAQLMKQLDYVWENSLLYQEKYRAAGIERNDIKTLSDLSKLPFTEKYEIRESLAASPPLGKHACVHMKDVIRIYSTSGTTGNPTYIALTSHDRDVWAEGAMRAMWACGMRPQHIVPLPIGTFFIAASYGEAIERLGSTLVPVGIGATDRF